MIPEGTLMRVNHHTKDYMNFIQQKYYFVQEGMELILKIGLCCMTRLKTSSLFLDTSMI